VTEILKDMKIKLFGIINCCLSRDPKATYNVLPKEYFEPRYGYIDYRLRLYLLGEVFNCDHYILVISMCGC
jgi:hypothetical protein